MARKPGLRIDVRVDVLMDERYEALGDIAGYNRHEALGRMFALWAWCLDRQEFTLHEAIVRRFLGPRGVEAILGEVAPGEIVDSLALGERRDGGVYVRGSESLAWLGERRAAASKGGETRARAVRNGDGTFGNESHNSASQTGAKREPNGSQTGANVQPSDLLPDPDPDPDLEDLDQPPSGERGRPAPASPSPAPPPLKLDSPKAKAGRGRTPKHPLPDGWSPRSDEAELARRLGLNLDSQVERFRNHFIANAGTKANWHLTFRNWLHGSADRLSRNRGSHGAGFDALLHIANGGDV